LARQFAAQQCQLSHVLSQFEVTQPAVDGEVELSLHACRNKLSAVHALTYGDSLEKELNTDYR